MGLLKYDAKNLKGKFTEALKTHFGFRVSDSRMMYEIFINILIDQLIEAEKLEIPRFGTFKFKYNKNNELEFKFRATTYLRQQIGLKNGKNKRIK